MVNMTPQTMSKEWTVAGSRKLVHCTEENQSGFLPYTTYRSRFQIGLKTGM